MRARDTWVLIATIVGSSLAFIDGQVVNLALPQIQRGFHTSAIDVTWIIELYTLVLGSLMLLGGALADRYGRRRTFTIGVILFGIGSIACAFSGTLEVMYLARVVQGVGGTLLAPASLAILGAHFTGDARGRAIAAWSAFGALTSTLGPMLGGILIDSLGWRAVFWINIPLIAVVLYATLRHVTESRDESAPKHLDIFGAVLTIAGLGGITYALIDASSRGWNNLDATGSLISGVAILTFFLVRERSTPNPIIPPDIFRSRPFGAINLATLFLYGALSALFYMLPFVLIQTHGYTALQTAFATLPIAVCLVVLSRFGTAIAARVGFTTVLTIGPLLVACGFALLALLSHAGGYFASLFPGLALVGVGMGFTVAPLTTAVIDAAGPSHVGIASGINTAIARIAGLLAVAAATIVIAALYDQSLDRSLDALHATSAQRATVDAQRARLGGAQFSDPRLQSASRDAFDRGFAGVGYGCAILALAAGLVNLAGARKLRTDV